MEKIKPVLKNMDARLVGNIALVDRHHNFISFVTIFYWMFKAKKDRLLNIFPVPGVSEADIIQHKKAGSRPRFLILKTQTGMDFRKKW